MLWSRLGILSLGAAAIILSLQIVSSAKERGSTEKSSDRSAVIEKKLEKVLANQERILEQFEKVLEELQVVKIRATMR